MSAPLYSGFPSTSGAATGYPNVPIFQGPKGDTGAAGADGADGISSFTITTGNFIQPATGETVTVSVGDSEWMAPGAPVYIIGGGFYTVYSVPSTTSVILVNLGYTGNAVATTVVPIGSLVAPSGPKGADGADGTSTATNPGVVYGTTAQYNNNSFPGPVIWILSDSVPPMQLAIVPPVSGTGSNQQVYYGTQNEYDTAPPAGPGIWILSDSVPPYQMIPIPT